MDENDMPADQPAAQPTEPVEKKKRSKPKKRATPKAAPKAEPKKSRRVEVRAPKSPSESNAAIVAVFVILGVLALVTSFYVGYLVGKGAGVTTKTGSVGTEKLQVIEYSDYQCPFCGAAEPTVKQLQQIYGDKIELIYKNFPLESIHPNAYMAAVAAECVRKYEGNDSFWKYHDKLFANQNALDVPSLKQYAKDMGFSDQVQTCIDNKETDPIIKADQQEALAKGVQGTPSFWIKDELVVGAQPLDVFKQKIDEKLAGGTAPAAAAQPAQPAAPSAPPAKVDVATGPHVIGDPKAPVTVVEFSDYQCPFCKQFFTATESQFMDAYVKTGKVQFAYRNFPLPFHQNAEVSAEAAECVAKIAGNDAYWKYHDTLFTKGNGDGTGLDAASLKQYAKDQGIDATQFNNCLDNHDTQAIVAKDTQDGTTAGVQGTPTFYINGVQLVGAQPFSSFQAAIDAASKQ